MIPTAVSSEAWAKLHEWAILAGKGWLLLSGSVVLASLKAPVFSALVKGLGPAAADPSKLEIRHILVP